VKSLRILPYKPGSKSARAIAKALNGLRVRFNGLFRPKLKHLVVNWGKVAKPRWWITGLNDPAKVQLSSNKLTALSCLRQAGVSTPEFTDDIQTARQWWLSGSVVVGRQILNGHGGIGCIIFHKDRDDVDGGFDGEPRDCPLYTKHLRHKREFRIHVFKGQIIDQVEKLKKKGFENRNSWIRNYNNGYVFVRGGVVIPKCVRMEALQAVQALQLDFGAVDVAYREKEDKAYVLECNTAPGIEGQTIRSYIEAIRQELQRKVKSNHGNHFIHLLSIQRRKK